MFQSAGQTTYQYIVATNTETEDGNSVSLSAERARRFFRLLADEPFLALVVTEEGEVRIFSKDIESDHLDHIKNFLNQIQKED